MAAADSFSPTGWSPSPWMEVCAERDEARELAIRRGEIQVRLQGEVNDMRAERDELLEENARLAALNKQFADRELARMEREFVLEQERNKLRSLLDECAEYVVEAQNVATCGGRLEYKGRAEGYLLLRIDAALAKGKQ